jgi:hypothetical protein
MATPNAQPILKQVTNNASDTSVERHHISERPVNRLNFSAVAVNFNLPVELYMPRLNKCSINAPQQTAAMKA